MKASKKRINQVKELYQEAAQKVLSSPKAWSDFMTFSAKHWKHAFADVLSIYAQRPEATMVASMDTWNKVLHRWVSKGTKSIAVLTDGGALNYLFDVADTWSVKKEQSPILWQMNENRYLALLDRYQEKDGKDYNTLSDVIRQEIEAQRQVIMPVVYQEFATEEGELLIIEEQALDELFSLSIDELVSARCQLASIEKNLFPTKNATEHYKCFDFIKEKLYNVDKRTLSLMGQLIFEVSQGILKTLEQDMKLILQAEKQQRSDQDDSRIRHERRDLLPEFRGDGAGRDREVWVNGERFPKGELPGADSLSENAGELKGSLAASEPGSMGQTGRIGAAIIETRAQSRPNGHVRNLSPSTDDSQPSGRIDVAGDRFSETLTAGTVDGKDDKDKKREREKSSSDDELAEVAEITEAKQQDKTPNHIEHDKSHEQADGSFFMENLFSDSALTEQDEEKPQPLFEAMGIENSEDFADHHGENSIALAKNTGKKVLPERFNYHYHDGDGLAIEAGGVKTKFKANVTAIRLLKAIEKENRLATVEEQAVLAHYVGWGGMPQVFDESAVNWQKAYQELKTLLTEAEYKSARASTPNAHYTSPFVVENIYAALNQFGFKQGNILEPAMGIGNFFAALPDEMSGSRLFGVELDDLSGRLARQLFQKADIQISGFEKTAFENNAFDVVIGNVPFGDYKVFDKDYKHNLPIHNYFILKSVDKVRPGGIVAVITSKWTLDSAHDTFRKQLAQKADLIGAIRLPNTAFAQIANTDVTCDILFLQKREQLNVQIPDWVTVGETVEGVPVNRYYLDHPEMMLGKMVFDEKRRRMYGEDSTVTALISDETTGDWQAALQRAVAQLQAVIPMHDTVADNAADRLPADPLVKNFTYTVVEGQLYYRENGSMQKIKCGQETAERMKGLDQIRTITRELINMQNADCTDQALKEKQALLNKQYDQFVQVNGYINERANDRAFREDSDYPLLCALEIENENKEIVKADFFTKRTIRAVAPVTAVTGALDGLVVSLNEKGKVDLPLISQLYGKSMEAIIIELQGSIFLNPSQYQPEDLTAGWESADQYLSGNVREKLQMASFWAEQEPARFGVNVEALRQVQPPEVDAADIELRLGTSWIEEKDIERFIYDTLETPYYLRHENSHYGSESINVHYHEKDASWVIENKHLDKTSVLVNETYGTGRINAYKIIETSLNLGTVTIKDRQVDEEGKVKYVLNRDETMVAREKQALIKDAFKDWIFKDQDRRLKYAAYYNQHFNNSRVRAYDGSYLTFPGMNPDIKLRPHQRSAIARTLYGESSTLLAHCVGAGKSFEIIASCMERKRLGLATKSIIVVPNHLTGQMGAEFLRLYPNANILVTGKKDFEKINRKKFTSRIATGNYDAVIIGHSQFEKIPVSKARQQHLIEEQVEAAVEAIEQIKAENGENWAIKQMEGFIKNLNAQLETLLDDSKKDDLIEFEQLGIDGMFVDEAHNYKNCAVFSKMRHIAGISQTKAKKSSDMLMKCQYIQEISKTGVIFATGTAISNSMSEMFVLQRYLQNDQLLERGIAHFDAWAANFGEVVSSLELAPEGTGYRYRNRFAKFVNLPELMTMFGEIADVQTAEMLKLPVPQLKDGRYELIAAEPTAFTQEIMDDFVQRAERIRSGAVKSFQDNILKITNEARLLGTDPRLIDPMAPNDPQSKVNQCIDNVLKRYQESEAIRGVQVVFCDVGTPTGVTAGKFDLYGYVKAELTQKGIPEAEICFIHDSKTDEQKEQMFSDLRHGTKRVIIGSTSKLGVGTNIQTRLYWLHHLDCPYRPSDIEQREGRILRQGNTCTEVGISRYVTKNTFDSYLWGIVEQKQRFISQVMTSKAIGRSCEDIDETILSFAEVKALATGNPVIKEKIDVDNNVNRLQLLKAAHDKQHYKLQDDVTIRYPQLIARKKQQIADIKQDIHHRDQFDHNPFQMIIGGQSVNKREEAATLLADVALKVKAGEPLKIGVYKGFELQMTAMFLGSNKMSIQGADRYEIDLGISHLGNITRLENAVKEFESLLEKAEKAYEENQRNLAQAKLALEKVFPYEAELKASRIRQNELNALLDIGKKDETTIDDEETTVAMTQKNAYEADQEAER